MGDDNAGGATYNQAGFQQARLDELFTRIDRLSINKFSYNYDVGAWNYEIIFNDLNTIQVIITPKFNDKEEKRMNKAKEFISEILETRKIFTEEIEDGLGAKKIRKIPNGVNRKLIDNLLFMYRTDLEKLMDKHGFGNPSKKDPSKAVIDL